MNLFQAFDAGDDRYGRRHDVHASGRGDACDRVDTIIRAKRIYTLDPRANNVAEAIAMSGGRITDEI